MGEGDTGDRSPADVAASRRPDATGRAIPLCAVIPTARLDPWFPVVSCGATTLFGYCRWHEKLGGLSWLVSSPVVELDAGRLRACTLSGRVYALGQHITADDLPGEEARLAYRLLVGPGTRQGDPVPNADLYWLGALKVSRWLGIEAPARGRIAGLRGFLVTTRPAYRAALQAAGVGPRQ